MSIDLVSIVIPVYNVKDYLPQCIESVLSQTYSDIEVILVDDGSVDGSGAICDEYAQQDKRIVVFHQSNQGVVRARKRGIAYANGKYICFVDADDCIEETMIEFFIENIDDSDMITIGVKKVDAQGKITYQYDGFSTGIYKTKDEMQYFLSNVIMYENCCGSHFEYGLLPYMCNKMFKSSLAKSIIDDLDETMVYSEDHEFVIRYVVKAKSIVITKECLYIYKYRESSAINSCNKNIMNDLNKLYCVLEDVVKENPLKDILLRQLELLVSFRIRTIPMRMGFRNIAQCTRHIFPYTNILEGKKYILYGAGTVGISYYRQIRNMEEGELVLWVDKKWNELMELNGVINSVESIKKVEYDCILLAVEKEELAEDIRRDLLNMNINPEKIWWKKPILLMV